MTRISRGAERHLPKSICRRARPRGFEYKTRGFDGNHPGHSPRRHRESRGRRARRTRPGRTRGRAGGAGDHGADFSGRRTIEAAAARPKRFPVRPAGGRPATGGGRRGAVATPPAARPYHPQIAPGVRAGRGGLPAAAGAPGRRFPPMAVRFRRGSPPALIVRPRGQHAPATRPVSQPLPRPLPPFFPRSIAVVRCRPVRGRVSGSSCPRPATPRAGPQQGNQP